MCSTTTFKVELANSYVAFMGRNRNKQRNVGLIALLVLFYSPIRLSTQPPVYPQSGGEQKVLNAMRIVRALHAQSSHHLSKKCYIWQLRSKNSKKAELIYHYITIDLLNTETNQKLDKNKNWRIANFESYHAAHVNGFRWLQESADYQTSYSVLLGGFSGRST